MRTLEELEKELKHRRQCFEHCDNQRSVDAQLEYNEIRKLEIEIRKRRERAFGLEK